MLKCMQIMGLSMLVKGTKIFTKIDLSAHESWYIIKEKVGERDEQNCRKQSSTYQRKNRTL